MFIFKRFLNKRSPSDSHDSGQPEEIVRMYDTNGRQVFLPKSQNRDKVLPNAFHRAKNNPEELYRTIVLALQDNLFEECLSPARLLSEIESDKERSAIVLGIVLMKNNRLDEAQEVLERYLKENGKSGVVLTNLAKVFSQRGQNEKSAETLWKALTTDPNQENALDWWAAIHRERDGEDGFYTAIEKVAQVRGSWRPQLWLGRRLLEAKKIYSAMALYGRVLESTPEAKDALTMISGDLGNNGYLAQMLELVLPFYEPDKHDPMTGLNLIQACIKLGEKESGLNICEALDRLQRYDLKQHLEQLRTQLKGVRPAP